MWESDDFHSDSSGTVFRDVLMLALIGFVAMVIMLLPHISKTQDETDEHTPPGNVVIEMHWPDELPVDVDLWVQAPNDVPVGFWNQGSQYFNLLRDDLGKTLDLSSINHESAYSRGVAPGEYIINAHLYRSDRHRPPPFRAGGS